MSRWYMKEKGQYDTTPEGLFAGVDMVRTALQNYGMKTASLQKAKLLTEETISSMAAYAEPGAKITLSIKAVLETVTMELSCKGTEFQHADNISGSSWKDYMEEGQTEEDAAKRLSSMLVQTYAEEVKYQHKAGLNRVRIVVVRSKHAFLYRTLGALLLAILAGLLLSSLQLDIFNSLLDTYMLVPVKTMYMNALKMIVSPVVFFSIVSCIVRFSDLSELGRLGGRVILLYLLTTCIAVAVGIGSFYLFQPGNAGSAPAVTADISSITSAEVNISIKDLIVNIVPSNFIKPFLESNMLQLIFLAVICGIATGLIGKYSVIVKDIFEAFNDLFLKITTMIIGFMPIAIFCSILSMVLNTGAKTFLSVMGMFGTFLFGLACMMIVYCLLILIAGRLSPLPFIKKYSSTMLQVFSMASSNASIPVNMDACEKLGIAKKSTVFRFLWERP